MDKDSLSKGLTTRIIGQTIVYYDLTDSTNVQAKKEIKKNNISEGTVFIASKQTAGRGSGKNKWESEEPTGIWLSIILHEPYKMNPLTFVPGVALAKMLNECYNIKAHVKWPNDILVGNKKISGILCETAVQPDGIIACVVGIGINVNQTIFPDSIKNTATSMALVSGKEYVLEHVFKTCLVEFEKLYFSEKNAIDEWKAFSKMIGKVITIKKENCHNEVTVLDITKEGYLLIKDSTGKESVLKSRTDIDIDPDY